MKAIVLGVMHLKGTKKETGRDYDFFQVNLASSIEPVATPTMEKTGYGYEMQQIPLRADAFGQFNGLAYPIELDLLTDVTPRFGSMRTEVVGFKKLA